MTFSSCLKSVLFADDTTLYIADDTFDSAFSQFKIQF